MNLLDVLTGKYTRQEVFDYALAKIRAQGRDSSDEKGGFCAYRGVDNTMCPIGHMIPDGLYHSTMEGCSVEDLIHKHGWANTYTDPTTQNLLISLQHAHDYASRSGPVTFMNNFECRMQDIARIFGLSYTGEHS